MLLTGEDLAKIGAVAPFLHAAARAALKFAPNIEVDMELEAHLQPGMRIKAVEKTPQPGNPDEPPYPLNLFVGLPLDELRALANTEGPARDEALARFQETFAQRLSRAISKQTPHEINLEASVQSETGPLAVALDDATSAQI